MSLISKAVVREVFRIAVFLVAATIILMASSHFIMPDAAMAPVLTSSSIVMYLAAFTHVTRRILFPYIDLSDYAKKALDGNMSAGIVFAAVVFIMSTCITAGTVLLR